MKHASRRFSSPSRIEIDVAVQALIALAAVELSFLAVNGRAATGSELAGVFLLAGILALCGLILRAQPSGDRVRWPGWLVTVALAGMAGGAITGLLLSALPASLGVGWLTIAAASLAVTLLRTVGLYIRLRAQGSTLVRRSPARPTIVVGSGEAAASLVRLVRENDNFHYAIVGCVDDEMLATSVSGKPVLGSIDMLATLIGKHQVSCVIVAIPSVSPKLIKRVMAICMHSRGHGGKPPTVKILPGVLELLKDGVQASRIRPVQPEDLLPREPVKVDLSAIAPYVHNRVILVTGAGGSIGSELCRQLVALDPSLLLLLGHGENSLFDIYEELRLKAGFKRTRIVLADVADTATIRSVFSRYRPHVVFHSAAHKHVPIVETNVCAAARNNILGTHVVALAAAATGTAKFVLLSTDKAVNPSSVMGATKRVSELISQSFFNQTGTEFVTVRFGNVLESRGSVIPIFKKQIENGGPLTLTHRDMQRYFMTIPEAASLVLMAMAIGRDGQVLVLDMGQPVKILQLAETLITLSGLTPHRDIAIVETGIRPGEKLFEEILTSYEGLSRTSHYRLFTARQERIAYDALARELARLEVAVRTGDESGVLHVVRELVPSFVPGPHLQAARDGDGVADLGGAAEASASPDALAEFSENGHAQTLLMADELPQEVQPSHPTGVAGS